MVVINLFCRTAMETQTLKTDYGHSWCQEEGEGGRYGESNIATYITICK